jgi:hypothetical protein
VFTAGEQGGENTQVRVGELPEFCLPGDGFSGAHNGAEMSAAGNTAKMLAADSRQTGNFIFGVNFLRGFNGDHPMPSFIFLPQSFCRVPFRSAQKIGVRHTKPLISEQSSCRLTIQGRTHPLILQILRIKRFSGEIFGKESQRGKVGRIPN